ncbi:MAG TPA: hypothetical protein VF914_08635, partial [Chloroflexia bacterium]
PCLGEEPFPAIFIRAPKIGRVGEGVEVLASLPDGTPVAARQGQMLVTSFHPELTDDLRLHRYFLDMVEARLQAQSPGPSQPEAKTQLIEA